MNHRVVIATAAVVVSAAVAAGMTSIAAVSELWAAAAVIALGVVGWTAAWLAATHLASFLPTRTGPVLDLVLVVSSFSMLALAAGTGWLVTTELL